MIFVAPLASLLISLALVPLVRLVSIRLGRVAPPREDRWHQKPTPTLGGVGMYLSFVSALLIYAAVSSSWHSLQWGLLLGSSLMFGLGLYDDFKPLTPPAKMVGQIAAVMIVIYQGYTTSFFTPRLGDSLFAQLPNLFLTIFWLVGITNAINLLDNMDGLAGGIALVAALVMSILFWGAGNTGLLVICSALAGSVLGFLVFNFPPASIFMGDAGSMFLGFTLAVLAIARQPQASNVFAVLGVPTLLFLLPILDTTLVTITRILRGQSPAQGGRDHTSHRLIAFGLSERQAVITLYVVALVSGLVGLAVENLDYALSLLLVPLLVLSLALLTAYLGRLKVVSTPKQRVSVAITRLMVELTYRRRLLEIMLDFALIGIAYYLAFLVDYGFTMPPAAFELYLTTLPIAFLGAYIAFYTSGVYRGLWRYVGVDDLLGYVRATFGALMVLTPVVLYLHPSEFPVSVLLFYAVFLFLGLAASRSSFKILDQAYGQQKKEAEERVLIYGAGDAGEITVRWLIMNPQLGLRAVGFLDDDPFKNGRQIHGVDVLGGTENIEAILAQKDIAGVILTADGKNVERVTSICRQNKCWVRVLRFEFEQID